MFSKIVGTDTQVTCDDDDDMLRPIKYQNWGYEQQDKDQGADLLMQRQTEEESKTVKKKSKYHISDSDKSESEEADVRKFYTADSWRLRRQQRQREKSHHKAQLEFELQYQLEMEALAEKKREQKRDVSPPAIKTVTRRR